jgi:hypothetical protein
VQRHHLHRRVDHLVPVVDTELGGRCVGFDAPPDLLHLDAEGFADHETVAGKPDGRGEVAHQRPAPLPDHDVGAGVPPAAPADQRLRRAGVEQDPRAVRPRDRAARHWCLVRLDVRDVTEEARAVTMGCAEHAEVVGVDKEDAPSRGGGNQTRRRGGDGERLDPRAVRERRCPDDGAARVHEDQHRAPLQDLLADDPNDLR